MKIYQTFIILGLVSTDSAFLFGEPKNPHLEEYMEVQRLQEVVLHLDISSNNPTKGASHPHLPIHNFRLALDPVKPPEEDTVRLPVAHGDHPQLSGGPCWAHIQETGHFIDHQGQQAIQVPRAGWELVWKKDAQSGCLILALDVAQEYERNGVLFPKGVVYVHFPVYDTEGLAFVRASKRHVTEQAKKALEDRDTEMKLMQETPNLIMKAWHLRNVYAALETHSLQPLQHYETLVPDDDKDVIALPGNLHIHTNGICWQKHHTVWVDLQHKLGTAKLIAPKRSSNAFSKKAITRSQDKEANACA